MQRPTVGLIVIVALTILAVPLAAEAQQVAHIPRVGFLEPGHPGLNRAFRQGLHALGYVEGETVIVEWRSWEGHPERAPELIAELVRLKVDVKMRRSPRRGRDFAPAVAQDPTNEPA